MNKQTKIKIVYKKDSMEYNVLYVFTITKIIEGRD